MQMELFDENLELQENLFDPNLTEIFKQINERQVPKRVKIYHLVDDYWKDQGTGYCIGAIEDNSKAFLVVENENKENDILLKARIEGSIQYQKQQDTLVVWTDQEGIDIALSFQEPEGCSLICDFLIQVQRFLEHQISLVAVLSNDDNGATEIICGPIEYPTNPTMSFENLCYILNILQVNSNSAAGRTEISKFLNVSKIFLTSLIEVFQESEKSHNLRNLHKLCSIVKTLILYNENPIFDLLFNDETYFFNIIGILEYDPDFPTYKSKFRDFLQNESKFKEIIPIDDPEMKKFIISTFNFQFLKDVVLARLLDDPTVNSIATLIYFNQVEIINYLQENKEFLTTLFRIYDETVTSKELSNISEADSPNIKRDGVKMIHQFVVIAKSLQPSQRSGFFKTLVKRGLFKMIKYALKDSEVSIRVIGTELVVSILEQDASLINGISDENIIEKDAEEKEGMTKQTNEVSHSHGEKVKEKSEVAIESENEKQRDESLLPQHQSSEENAEALDLKEVLGNARSASESQISEINPETYKKRKIDEERSLKVLVSEKEEFINEDPKSGKNSQQNSNVVSKSVQGFKAGLHSRQLGSIVLSNDVNLLLILTDLLIAERDQGLKTQAYQAIKSLLDPNNASINFERQAARNVMFETDAYTTSFYEKVAPILFSPLIELCNGETKIPRYNHQLLYHLCDIITLCAKEHRLKARSFILENRVLEGIVKLQGNPAFKDSVQLASIRCLKSILLLDDEFYTRNIIKNNLLNNSMQLLLVTSGKINLMNSTVLDLLDIIIVGNQENLYTINFKLLAQYVHENFRNILEEIGKCCNSGRAISDICEGYAKEEAPKFVSLPRKEHRKDNRIKDGIDKLVKRKSSLVNRKLDSGPIATEPVKEESLGHFKSSEEQKDSKNQEAEDIEMTVSPLQEEMQGSKRKTHVSKLSSKIRLNLSGKLASSLTSIAVEEEQQLSNMENSKNGESTNSTDTGDATSSEKKDEKRSQPSTSLFSEIFSETNFEDQASDRESPLSNGSSDGEKQLDEKADSSSEAESNGNKQKKFSLKEKFGQKFNNLKFRGDKS